MEVGEGDKNMEIIITRGRLWVVLELVVLSRDVVLVSEKNGVGGRRLSLGPGLCALKPGVTWAGTNFLGLAYDKQKKRQSAEFSCWCESDRMKG